MATNFPGSVDSFTNPSSGDTLDSPSHAAQHTNINDAMVAVQTRLGTGSGTIGGWTAYTPTVTAQTGTLTTVTVEYSKYARINDLIIYTARIDIVNAGTGSGHLAITVPIAPAALPSFTCYGRETQVTGDQLSGEIFSSPAKLAVFFYDGSGIVTTGRKISVTTIYEAA